MCYELLRVYYELRVDFNSVLFIYLGQYTWNSSSGYFFFYLFSPDGCKKNNLEDTIAQIILRGRDIIFNQKLKTARLPVPVQSHCSWEFAFPSGAFLRLVSRKIQARHWVISKTPIFCGWRHTRSCSVLYAWPPNGTTFRTGSQEDSLGSVRMSMSTHGLQACKVQILGSKEWEGHRLIPLQA